MDVIGYVLMPEHLHMIVGEPTIGLLADALKMFKLSVANRQAVRPFWQKRYYDRNLCKHNAMVECLRYTHRNPVARGLVRQAEEWPWSSYRHYLLGERRRVTVDSEWSRVEAAWKGFEEPVVEVDTGSSRCDSLPVGPLVIHPMSENPDMGHTVKSVVSERDMGSSIPRQFVDYR